MLNALSLKLTEGTVAVISPDVDDHTTNVTKAVRSVTLPSQLPKMSLKELQSEFDALTATNRKKAPSWIERVNELILEQF